MYTRTHKHVILIKCIYLIIDISFILLSILLAFSLRKATLSFDFDIHRFFFDLSNPFRLTIFVWMLIVLFFNQANGLYQTKRELLEGVEIAGVFKAVFISTFVVIVLGYLLKLEAIPRGITILSVILIGSSLSLWRVLKKAFVEYLVSRGYNNFNAIIIGAGKVGKNLEAEISKRPGLGVHLVGFLDDFKVKDSSVIGTIEDFELIAQREFISKVFITIHHDSSVFMKLLETSKDLGIAVHVVPQGYEVMGQNFSKYSFGVIPILEYSEIRQKNCQFGKRLFDFVLSSAGLLLIWPLLIVISVAIKLDTRGPIMYRSKRYGRAGKIFYMYKFRTMVCNAEDLLTGLKIHNEVDGPIFKIRKDPRITPFGMLLRKYSADELLQLINVVKGEMSLVGPRPFPIDQIEREDLRQLKRLDVRPGITGLWQIRGRSDVSFDRLLRWDIWYITNWSFGLDMHILFQTFPVVMRAKGAY